MTLEETATPAGFKIFTRPLKQRSFYRKKIGEAKAPLRQKGSLRLLSANRAQSTEASSHAKSRNTKHVRRL